MSSKWMAAVLIIFFLVSCGDSVSTKSKPKPDSDITAVTDDDSSKSDDTNVNDNETVNDNEVTSDGDSIINDDAALDEDISETCGNLSVEWPEVCDGGTIDCVDIDNTLYSGGKAKCNDYCSGWDTGTCEELKQNECTDGTRQCYGAYQYQICDDYDDDGYTEWGEAQTCSNSGTCSGNGLCSNDCYPHGSYSCYNGNVFWYDSCGTREEQKESCGTSGYTGSNYCYDDSVYRDYSTKGCDYDDCTESTEATLQEECYNGCTSGTCNAEKEDVWYDSVSGLYWQNGSFTSTSTHSTATTYCSNLSLGSYSDWRLPSIGELRSLVRGCSYSQTGGSCGVTDSCTSYTTCFTSCSACNSSSGPSDSGMYWDADLTDFGNSFWSSTVLSDYTSYRYKIDFTTAGLGYSETTASNYVRCVRGTMSGGSLTAPTGVSASDGSYDNYVYISWTAVSGATNYYIYRATSSSGTYSYVGESGGSTSYYDYPPYASTTYYYKVSAYNSTYGESVMSSYNSGSCY